MTDNYEVFIQVMVHEKLPMNASFSEQRGIAINKGPASNVYIVINIVINAINNTKIITKKMFKTKVPNNFLEQNDPHLLLCRLCCYFW